MKSSGAAWKGSKDREDGVCQISLRSDWIEWKWSVCGHIVCANGCVIMCVCPLAEWCLYKLKRPPIGLYGSWEPALSGSPLAISSHTHTHPLHTQTSEVVVWHGWFSQLLSASVSTLDPLEQISTTCFCQLVYSYTCLNLYSVRATGPTLCLSYRCVQCGICVHGRQRDASMMETVVL